MAVVGLDLRGTDAAFKEHLGRGTGRYVTELAKALSFIPTTEYEAGEGRISLRQLYPSDVAGSKFEQFVTKSLPFGRVTFETQFLLPKRIARKGLDLIHFPAHGDAPRRSTVPYVVTVLDLIPLRFPDLYKADKPNWRFRLARYLELEAIRQACGIFAISECTRRDLVELLGLKSEDIVVTPLAVSENFKKTHLDLHNLDQLKPRLRQELSLEEAAPLLLYVGGIDARKNIWFMLETFAELVQTYKLTGKENLPKLLLVGRYEEDRNYPRLVNELRNLGVSDFVQLMGFVPEAKLPVLYSAADVVLFPSLYEGFGFPALEAMASGTPVLCGRNSSLPEVVGENYPLLEDNNISAWVKEIRALLDDRALRARLSEIGWHRSKLFEWSRTAELTYEGYQKFLREKDGSKRREQRIGNRKENELGTEYAAARSAQSPR